MGKTQLLAPAGDMACLEAAIAAGADAVYLGGQRFGARAYAGNFDDGALLEALQLAHFFHRKIYLTVNTLTKEEELAGLAGWIAPFYEAGLDGVIVQDMGVLECLRENFPDLPLHASTQMTVTEAETALFLKGLGVSRIVPARELSLEEIIRLKEETDMELEVFIHGAMCYSYSGQCLFSSMLGGRSGNRGRCAQPCRQPYCALSKQQDHRKGRREEQYPLSLKDLCALPFLPKLLDAGVDSFKIEGRMKGPEYVAGVTAVYRKYMDLYEQAPKDWKVLEADMALLSGLYVRGGLSGGYLDRHNGKEMVSLQKPGYAGASKEVLDEIRRTYLEKPLTKSVKIEAALQKGKPARIAAVCEGVRVAQKGAEVQAAQKRPLARADVEKQLAKTGGSRFMAESVAVTMEEDVFLPVSSLNELRRTALDALWDEMAKRCQRPGKWERKEPDKRCIAGAVQNPAGSQSVDRSGFWQTAVYVSVLSMEQAMKAMKNPDVARVYLASEALMEREETGALWHAVRERKQRDAGFSFYLVLPVILRAYSKAYFETLLKKAGDGECRELIDGLMAGGLSGALWARRFGWEKAVSFQHSVSVFNRSAWEFLMTHFSPDSYTASLELNKKELAGLPAPNMEMMVYGKIPMMYSAGCVRRTKGECRTAAGFSGRTAGIPRRIFWGLQDRYSAAFPVLINCHHCMNTIYNSVPLSLHQYLDEIKARHIRAVRLDFTDESCRELMAVLEFFTGGKGEPPSSYTTGHYKKGVQ